MDSISTVELSDENINDLMESRMESDDLEFKSYFSLVKRQSYLEVFKDIFAMANTNGGHIILGINNNYEKKGLPDGYGYGYDATEVVNTLKGFCYPRPDVDYKEIKRNLEGEEKIFAVIYVRPTKEIIITTKDGNYQTPEAEQKIAFKARAIYVRKGSSSEEADYADIRKMINRIINSNSFPDDKRLKINSLINHINGWVNPDIQREKIYSNLLRLSNFPTSVIVANSTFNIKKEVYDYLAENGTKRNEIPAFILKESSLFTFSNLQRQSNPLRKIVNTGTIIEMKSNEILSDETHASYFIELLYATIRTHLHKKGLFFDREYQRFYYVTDGEEKEFKWKALSRMSTLKVVRMYKRDDKIINYQHRALRFRILIFDKVFYLLIDPGWTFTYDGFNLINPGRRGSLSNRLSRGLSNKRFLYIIKFWISRLFSSGKIFVDEDNFYCIDTEPLYAESSFGLRNDYLELEEFFKVIPEEDIQIKGILEEDEYEELDLEEID